MNSVQLLRLMVGFSTGNEKRIKGIKSVLADSFRTKELRTVIKYNLLNGYRFFYTFGHTVLVVQSNVFIDDYPWFHFMWLAGKSLRENKFAFDRAVFRLSGWLNDYLRAVHKICSKWLGWQKYHGTWPRKKKFEDGFH